jgi:hypothetical protein
MSRRLPPFSLLLVWAAALLSGGCQEPTSPEDLNRLVVQAYLYADQPVADVYISSSFAIGSTDTAGPPVSAATVRLSRNGTVYTLSPVTDRPGYYRYEGSDLSVLTGNVFSLDVQWGSQHATASTVVPMPPADIVTSADTVRVRVETGFGGMQRVVSDDSCVVRWTGSEGDLFFVALENVDSNAVQITSSSLPGMLGMGMPSQPMPQNHYRIRTESLRETGNHVVRVYRVNKEYADLYRSRAQDTRSLNEPLTNIQNGLGVFSAFASDSVGVVVALE